MIFKFFSSVDCKNTLQDNRAFLTFIQMLVDISLDMIKICYRKWMSFHSLLFIFYNVTLCDNFKYKKGATKLDQQIATLYQMRQ